MAFTSKRLRQMNKLIYSVLLRLSVANELPHYSTKHPLHVNTNLLDEMNDIYAHSSGRARIVSHFSNPVHDDEFILTPDFDHDFREPDMISLNIDPNHSPFEPDISSKSSTQIMHVDEIRQTIGTLGETNKARSDELKPINKGKFLKTGTTIVGVQTKDGIILAADTRATEGSVVADTRCEKVHQLSRNVWCCGAGTSGDLDALTRKVRYNFLLKNMIRDSIGNDGFAQDQEEDIFQSEEEIDINQCLGDASISAICQFIRNVLTRGGGHIGANLVLAGVDAFTKQPVLAAVHPHGSIDVVPFTALGSGGLAATGVLEATYTTDMTMEAGIQLVKDAVLAGIKNDLGSGSQVDMVIITADSVEYKRAVVTEEELVFSEQEKNVERQIYERHAHDLDTSLLGGVNGFGMPYSFKSTKLVLEDEDLALEEKKEKIRNTVSGVF
ncbi:hypothetical protein CTEN210_15479 [Chaetoceros tenuissimus]|uniref:Proteasome endopeptidase complex n=1 Tax=Chaetoceros tenuissimus TaxID=426638 RepID=A0AAD3D707_9STRA|nr:hypothetical protein CTEN210_15479 [Chaetoceros tenuissimus]